MTTALKPQVVKNETQAMDAALDGTRRRPALAINDEGQLVVCSPRTARRNGWELQGKMFARTRKEK